MASLYISHTHTHTYIHTYIHTHTCTCTHTHTHTIYHTHPRISMHTSHPQHIYHIHMPHTLHTMHTFHTPQCLQLPLKLVMSLCDDTHLLKSLDAVRLLYVLIGSFCHQGVGWVCFLGLQQTKWRLVTSQGKDSSGSVHPTKVGYSTPVWTWAGTPHTSTSSLSPHLTLTSTSPLSPHLTLTPPHHPYLHTSPSHLHITLISTPHPHTSTSPFSTPHLHISTQEL